MNLKKSFEILKNIVLEENDYYTLTYEKLWKIIKNLDDLYSYLSIDEENYKEISNNIENLLVSILKKGYLIVDYDNTGLLCIQKDDLFPLLLNDEDAVFKAKIHNIQIIPENELPEYFPLKNKAYWIDTPENRKNIQEYTQLNF